MILLKIYTAISALSLNSFGDGRAEHIQAWFLQSEIIGTASRSALGAEIKPAAVMPRRPPCTRYQSAAAPPSDEF
jgi:hypothetical protein